MPRKLKDIEIEEITLCDEPAIRKKFYIRKRREQMEELLKVLKKLLGEETIDEKTVEKMKGLPEDKTEDIRKALEEIEGYQENFPPKLDEAFLSLAKAATYDYPTGGAELDFEDIEKAGAALSKATIEQLRKIGDIIKKLIGEKAEKFKDKDGKDLPEDIVKKLERADELEKAEKERIEKEKQEKEEAEKQEKEDMKKRLEKLEKNKGIKKSIEGQEDTDAGGGDEGEKWPSLNAYVSGEEK